MIKKTVHGVGFPFYSADDYSRFKRVFGLNLRTFWGITGFDICAFDDWLKTPDGISTADFLTEKYGAAVCEFVRSLIGGGV